MACEPRSTSRSRARTRTTWSRPASRAWGERCARPSGATAPGSPAPRGSFEAPLAMERLRTAGLTNVLRTLTQPVLGVCLGMQLLFARSEEGPTPCLGILPSAVQRLQSMPGRPVPHMGWNQLRRLKADPLLEGIEDGAHAYFVHSYAAAVTEHTLATAEYGLSLCAAVRRGNFWGTQFHPERSAATGVRVLRNFLGQSG